MLYVFAYAFFNEPNPNICSSKVVFLWKRTLVAFVDKLSSTTVDFMKDEVHSSG